MSERHAHLREPIDIWRFRLRISPQVADPMVQIVHHNKEHIRFRRFSRESLRRDEKQNTGEIDNLAHVRCSVITSTLSRKLPGNATTAYKVAPVRGINAA